jgi:hypothetical protein
MTSIGFVKYEARHSRGISKETQFALLHSQRRDDISNINKISGGSQLDFAKVTPGPKSEQNFVMRGRDTSLFIELRFHNTIGLKIFIT